MTYMEDNTHFGFIKLDFTTSLVSLLEFLAFFSTTLKAFFGYDFNSFCESFFSVKKNPGKEHEGLYDQCLKRRFLSQR